MVRVSVCHCLSASFRAIKENIICIWDTGLMLNLILAVTFNDWGPFTLSQKLIIMRKKFVKSLLISPKIERNFQQLIWSSALGKILTMGPNSHIVTAPKTDAYKPSIRIWWDEAEFIGGGNIL